MNFRLVLNRLPDGHIYATVEADSTTIIAVDLPHRRLTKVESGSSARTAASPAASSRPGSTWTTVTPSRRGCQRIWSRPCLKLAGPLPAINLRGHLVGLYERQIRRLADSVLPEDAPHTYPFVGDVITAAITRRPRPTTPTQRGAGPAGWCRRRGRPSPIRAAAARRQPSFPTKMRWPTAVWSPLPCEPKLSA